jgi:hypothetical protein
LFSKELKGLAPSIFSIARISFFSRKNSFDAKIYFSFYTKRTIPKTAGVHPTKNVPTRRDPQKLRRANVHSREQFFRQCERNKPQALAGIQCPFPELSLFRNISFVKKDPRPMRFSRLSHGKQGGFVNNKRSLRKP